MSGALEGVAQTWLTDQPWQKVFKNVFDVIEDYISYLLISVGAISLSVRLLTTLGTGDVSCIIIGASNEVLNITSASGLGPYPRGGSTAMVNYAQTHPNCIRAVFTSFGEYLPYIMLLETLVLIVVEKFGLKMPRIAQRMERFYTNIVQEPLFGKDPDAIEDMINPNTSIEATSRERQRNEICVSLKRTNTIYNWYLARNIVEIFLIVVLYTPINMVFLMSNEEKNHPSCNFSITEVPSIIDFPGTAYFQCHAKKANFFQLALGIQIALLFVHGGCSVGAIVWCQYYRHITGLLKHIKSVYQNEKIKEDRYATIDKSENSQIWIRTNDKETEDIFEENDPSMNGKDFLFLFDMLAHTCGIELTLRVLTHSDDQFFKIFKPKLVLNRTKSTEPEAHVEEDKLKVEWKPSFAELWLHPDNAPSARCYQNRLIDIDAYEATIFPAEKIKNTRQFAAYMKEKKKQFDVEEAKQSLLNGNDTYTAWFYDLAGGTTEYVVTIASIVGKSRMKGEKLITYLLPYGAEKPRGGMVKEADGNPGTNQIEIFWEPPRGDFTKYVLYITKIPNSKLSVTDLPALPPSFNRLNSVQSKASVVPYNLSNAHISSNHSIMDQLQKYNINSKLTTYTISGLQPGEKYEAVLETETGTQLETGRTTRQAIYDIILTKPLPPRNVDSNNITTNSCKFTWQHPEGCSCLVGYQILVKSGSDVKNQYSLLKMNTSYTVRGLSEGTIYDIYLTTVCKAKREEYGGDEERKTESVPVKFEIITHLEKIRNLQLDSSSHDYFSVKWDTVSPNMYNTITIRSYKGIAGSDLFSLDDSQLHEKENEEGQIEERMELQKLENFERVVKEVSGEQRHYKFTDFPDKVGSGFPYEVEIVSTAKLSKENKDKEAVSEPVKKVFFTKPHPPSHIHVDNNVLKWGSSPTPHVTEYHISWDILENDEKVTKEELHNVRKVVISGPIRNNPFVYLSDLFEKQLDNSQIVIIRISAVVSFPNLDAPLNERRSLEISEKFQLNEDGCLGRYVDEQNSMVP